MHVGEIIVSAARSVYLCIQERCCPFLHPVFIKCVFNYFLMIKMHILEVKVEFIEASHNQILFWIPTSNMLELLFFSTSKNLSDNTSFAARLLELKILKHCFHWHFVSVSEIYLKLENPRCQKKGSLGTCDSDSVFCIIAVVKKLRTNSTQILLRTFCLQTQKEIIKPN